MTTGWRTILAIDHDAKACETYRANMPGVRVACGNVADYLDEIAGLRPDVIIGGPPCQPYSSAGKQAGEDDARDCVPDFCAAVERGQPRMFHMEEVDAFAVQKKFEAVFARTVKRLTDAGYEVMDRVMDAVNYGVPQFRNRAWLWGIRSDLYASGVRHEWPRPTHVWPHPQHACMFGGDLLPAVTVGQALGLEGTCDAQNGVAHGPGRQSGTLLGQAQSKGGKAGHYALLSHADPARAVELPSPSLRSGGSEHDGCCVRLHEYRWSDAMREKHPPASPASPPPTVLAKWYKGGAEGLISDDGRTWEDRHPPSEPSEPSGTLRGRSPRDAGRCVEGVVRDGPLVRRLTVAECARLQSMPDDFAWPASVAKTHRYRIIGNGWASLMAKRISERFRAVDPDAETVVDLFCGGGCGAVGWHGRAWEYTGVCQ